MVQKITTNITARNYDLEVLKKHFPHCFDKNKNFDFEKFKKELLKSELDFSKENYGIDWLGKSYARLLASDPATTLLKEDKNWNTKQENKDSQNLLLKGDNLEILKHLSNAYYEKIKMIYIDPPYNTGSDDFVYQDNRKFTVEEFQKLSGVDEEQAKKILSFVSSKSNSHSAWLTFMYPRLYIAKQLLKDDGVIFVSIDDNEVAQLRILMDDIFGEENFVGIFSVENNPKGRKNSDYISITNEYCLTYSKNKDKSSFIENIPKNIKDLTTDEDDNYIHNSGKRVLVGESSNDYLINNKSDKHYSVYYNKNKNELLTKKEGSISDEDNDLLNKGYKRYISSKDGKFLENTYTANKLIDLLKNNALVFREDKIFEKNFNTTIRIKSIIKNIEYNAIVNNKETEFKIDVKTTSAGTYLKELFNTEKPIFEMSKNVGLLKILMTLFFEKDFTILDFFAGSGTTGDAVMQLNSEDGGNRKYILVQIPEKIDEKKNKTAYDFVKNELKVDDPTIFEVTKERLVRAGKKIQSEQKEKNSLFAGENKQDFGFKIFETQPIWEDYYFEAEELDPQAKLFDESKLSKDDLQTLLTTWKTYDNIPLTQDLQKIDLGGYTGYYSDKKLYLMDKGFKIEHLKNLLEKIDSNEDFIPANIIVFGYHFESKSLREISENISSYANKKNIDIDFITRY